MANGKYEVIGFIWQLIKEMHFNKFPTLVTLHWLWKRRTSGWYLRMEFSLRRSAYTNDCFEHFGHHRFDKICSLAWSCISNQTHRAISVEQFELHVQSHYKVSIFCMHWNRGGKNFSYFGFFNRTSDGSEMTAILRNRHGKQLIDEIKFNLFEWAIKSTASIAPIAVSAVSVRYNFSMIQKKNQFQSYQRYQSSRLLFLWIFKILKQTIWTYNIIKYITNWLTNIKNQVFVCYLNFTYLRRVRTNLSLCRFFTVSFTWFFFSWYRHGNGIQFVHMYWSFATQKLIATVHMVHMYKASLWNTFV